MKTTILLASAWFAAGAALAQSAAAPASATAPIVVRGTVADGAAKAALLARLRQLFGAERVVDELSVGPVAASPGWNEQLHRLVGPGLKLVSHGQLQVDGSAVSLRGDVASEAQRQQVGAELAGGLDPAFSLTNSVRVAASDQGMLDQALRGRIIEFDTGKATLTDSGRALLDEMSAALLKLKDQKVALIGHTDNAGARASNLSLSQARAEAVKTYMIGKGIKADAMLASGEGPDRPVGDNRSADGRARNRRIEFKVLQ
ncbi:MAG: OmpA family protein [Pseudomonadota bacterium]|nr:OmpA family protein [Pseudomonadota bacterium]